MTAPSADAGVSGRRIELARPSPETAELRLSGSWRLTDGLLSTEELAERLGPVAGLRRLRVDAGGIEAWDSGLVTSLERLATACREHGAELEWARLPDGAQRLIDLAAAVPAPADGARRPAQATTLARVGELTLGLLRGGPELARFLAEVQGALARAARGRARYRRADFWLTVQQVGPDALPIVALISFLVGVILAYMGALQLVQFGAEIYIADLVAIGMVRELGALMTGIILAGRSGAAFAAQIGTMQVNEEVDALRTLGIAPIEYLVLPRLLALIVMMPLLTVYSGLAGMLAGLFVSTTVMGIDGFEYVQQSLRALSLEHFLVGLSKGTVYGVLIALAGCLRGMQCGRSAQAVGEATPSAVVTSILWIVISASFLTVLYQHLGI